MKLLTVKNPAAAPTPHTDGGGGGENHARSLQRLPLWQPLMKRPRGKEKKKVRILMFRGGGGEVVVLSSRFNPPRLLNHQVV